MDPEARAAAVATDHVHGISRRVRVGMSRPSATWSPDARSSATCAGVGLPYRASLTGQGLVRVSDASGWRHRPPVGGSTPLGRCWRGSGRGRSDRSRRRVPPIPSRSVSSAGPPPRSSSRTTVTFVAAVAALPAMGYPHGTAPITRPAAINRNASAAARVCRFRGAKRDANVGRRQATSPDNQRWFVQLTGPSGHTQPRAPTRRMRLKNGRSAVLLPWSSI